MGFDLIWIAIGIAAAGYFISNGLKTLKILMLKTVLVNSLKMMTMNTN